MIVVFFEWCHPLFIKLKVLGMFGVFQIETLDFGCMVQYPCKENQLVEYRYLMW